MDSQATTPTSTLFNIEEIHVELSSKCTLKCPRCPRTELKPEFLNREISLEEFKTSFDSVLPLVKKLVFCGDVGDPIYAKDFLDIVRYVKANSPARVSIVTNGSYKTVNWWVELGRILHSTDQVTFSLDGWNQETNEQYRVNSDWASIEAGIRALRDNTRAKLNWSAIYFNFNEDYVNNTMMPMAKELGFDSFEIVRSSKFGAHYSVNGVDPLLPSPVHVSSTSMYQKQKFHISKPFIHLVKRNTAAHEWARCLRWEKELFINVDGLVFPCPWFNSGYQQNDFVQKYKDRMSIKTRTLQDILDDPMWDEFITRIELMPLDVCKIKCKDCRE